MLMHSRQIGALLTLLLLGVSAGATDWKKVEADHDALCARLSASPRTRPWRIRNTDVPVKPELGINIHAMDERVAEHLKALGICSIRRTVYWNLIENTTAPGVYNQSELQKLDAEVAMFRRYGIEPLLLVHGDAPGTSFAERDKAFERFAGFMAFLANRYRNEVRHWELWNEMDSAFSRLFGTFDGVPMLERGKIYSAMLKKVVPAIRAANPEAVIVAGGMTDFGDFPRGIYQGGGKDYFDVMNIHTYGTPLAWSFVPRGVAVRAIMDEYGDGDKPLWNTEFGIASESIAQAWGVPKDNAVAWLDQAQSDQLKPCVEFNEKARIYQKYFVYALYSWSEGSADFKEKLNAAAAGKVDFHGLSFSLIRTDGSLRPAYRMLQKRGGRQ